MSDAGEWSRDLLEGMRTGREMVEAMVRGDVSMPPMAVHLGIRLASVGDGEAEMVVAPQPHHANAGGVAHGGLAATLIDSCTGCALWSVVGAGEVIATVDLGVTYLRPVTSDVDRLVCHARVVHRGSTVGVADAEVTDGGDRTFAVGKATYAIRSR